jgi:glycosyltransferase involved in cell wall biosynthesis
MLVDDANCQAADRTEQGTQVEVTVVIPCLNEHETVATCVRKAVNSMSAAGIRGEVVVADNGSSDGSIELATAAGARVVPVAARGYGNALMGGIAAARGHWIIMGDADDSYDFSEVPRFVARLAEGRDLVQGCRLPAGGGRITPGAMPWLHRWVGNPILTFLARKMFRVPIHDIYCGMRGFTKAMYQRLDLRCTGMEFATEMIIKANLFGQRISEVPITLWPDGRKLNRRHLRTFRDGWRTLRFFLLFSPRWLFWLPGWLLLFAGIVGYLLALPGLKILGVTFDAHTLLVASMLLLLGFQSMSFAVLSAAVAVNQKLRPLTPRVARFFQIFSLERGLMLGLGGILVGAALIAAAVVRWTAAGFGALDYPSTMRLVVPGTTAVTLGAGAILNSFLCSMLGLERK